MQTLHFGMERSEIAVIADDVIGLGQSLGPRQLRRQDGPYLGFVHPITAHGPFELELFRHVDH